MPDFDNLPECFEQARIADEIMANAYETVSAQERARLKTSQALVLAVHAEPQMPRTVCTRSAATGYEVCISEAAAPWVICVADQTTPPARLTAALTTARLAGTDCIAMVFLDANIPPAAMTALDLCGIEHVFILAESMTAELLRHACMTSETKGRLLLLADSAALATCARELALPCWDTAVAMSPALMTGTALKGCWQDTSLTPLFFINKTLKLQELPQEGCHA